jgi:thiol-disulfide isomerase/thioredoxin
MSFVLSNQHFCQNVTIRGKAHLSYAGKQIGLFKLADGITKIDQREDQDTIGADGFFELKLQSEVTQPVFIRINNVVAKLYVEPDYVYGITFPELEEGNNYKNDAELEVNVGIVGADSTELNVLISDYEELVNGMFTSADSRFYSKPMMFKKIDSLKLLCDKRYETIKNDYFKNYVEYSIASINASVSRGENYLINGYVIGKKIQYNHYEYMQFFNSCFSGYVKAATAANKGLSLFQIINVKEDYNLLSTLLKNDKFLKQDSLRELVLIKNLWDFYFSPDFEQNGVKNIVTQLNQQTKILAHRRITSTMLSYFNKMQPGILAPGFTARSRENTMATLASFKNRWVYLNFFATSNTESLKEMPKIAALKKKYGDKISFVSICVDDSLSTYKEYLKANPKFDWAIWFNNASGAGKTAKESYFVTGNEAYFLISNTGYLVQSPAISPSNGIESKFNLLFKSGKKKTKTGIR